MTLITRIKLLKAERQKVAVGRRSLYSDELADAICDRISEGESLRAICAEGGMPSKGTVMRWLDDGTRPEFRGLYTVLAGGEPTCSFRVFRQLA